ncbi:glutaredoxin family protein [Oxalicibacterium solurbis]|uniref:glutaredoxin family protein n=1 Tax=Oxalicibacterium solurbis TaxID=69280 RepID=UPI001E44C3EB|nr:glutaredoxin family protein [Oxalicibacterium solurbis]
MIRFMLYSRTYCHLCDDMLAALSALSMEQAHTIEVIDVDADEALVARYDELVPVLTASRDNGPARQLCHYFLDEAAVRAFLAND